MNIDLGGGTAPASGHVNLDPRHGSGRWKIRAQDVPWPAEDGTVDRVRASHVLEHIPAGQPRIAVFNEAHRVLVDAGQFEVLVPLFPSWQAVADPTHKSLWVAESFWYFDGRCTADADYGILPWDTDMWEVRGGWEGRWVGTPNAVHNG